MYARPVFQGKLNADVEAIGPAPLITWQIGAFRADAARRGAAAAPLRASAMSADAGAIRRKPEAPFKEAEAAVNISRPSNTVAVGRSIKGREHLKLAEQLAVTGRGARGLATDLRLGLAPDGSANRQFRGASQRTSACASASPARFSTSLA